MENNQDLKKFRIQELLNSVPYRKRKQVKEELIALMDVSEPTFERIIYARKGDKQEISATNLLRVSRYFNVPPDELVNDMHLPIGADLVK